MRCTHAAVTVMIMLLTRPPPNVFRLQGNVCVELNAQDTCSYTKSRRPLPGFGSQPQQVYLTVQQP